MPLPSLLPGSESTTQTLTAQRLMPTCPDSTRKLHQDGRMLTLCSLTDICPSC